MSCLQEPPPYEVGKIYGAPEDIATARKILAKYNPSANIIAAWSVDPLLIAQMRNWAFFSMCICCPIMCPAVPFQMCMHLNHLEVLRHTVYILTEDGLTTSVEDCKQPCACATTGNDFKEVLFVNMGDISVSNRGTGCCATCTTPAVTITLLGQNTGVAMIYTQDPEGVAHLVRQARKAHTRSERRAAQAPTVVVQQPTATAGPAASKRVIVATSKAPGAVKVVAVSDSTTWAQFLDEAAKKLGIAGRVARVELQLPGDSGSLEINALDDVQNNDKVLFFA